ncbi:Lysozyme [compost metagenome]
MYGLRLKSWGRRNLTLKEDVEQSMSVLLLTRKGEKIWAPRYGCDLLLYLDRPNWHIQLAIVAILEAVTAYEPRVQLLRVNIHQGQTVDDSASGRVTLELVYRLRALGVIETMLLAA